MIAFAGTGIIGVVLTVLRALGKRRVLTLLKMGVFVEGKLIALAKPETEKTIHLTSYEALFSFRDQVGRDWKGKTWIGWRNQFQSLHPGVAVPICYNPSHPRQNILLYAIL